jgi:hypothetical protein
VVACGGEYDWSSTSLEEYVPSQVEKRINSEVLQYHTITVSGVGSTKVLCDIVHESFVQSKNLLGSMVFQGCA